MPPKAAWARPPRLTPPGFPRPDLSGLVKILRRECADLPLCDFLLVRRRKVIQISESVQDILSLQVSWFGRQEGMIRRVGPVAKVGGKAVLLWVPVNVDDEAGIVGLGGHFDTAKGMLEQVAGAPVGFVDSFGVGVEKLENT